MEIMVMRELNHPNLVTYKEIFLEKKKLFIVMEFMDGGMLADIVMNLGDSQLYYTVPFIKTLLFDLQCHETSINQRHKG